MAINKINKLRFYAQKILPLTYDNSLTYLEWLEKVVATCNEVVTTINSIIDVVEDVESDVDEIQTQVTGILASIGGIQTHLTNIDSNIGSLNGRVGNVETAISSIQSSITSIQGEVATLRGRVNSLSSELDTLSGTVAYNGRRISTLETSVSDMSDNIGTIETDIANIESALTTLNGVINGHTSQIEELENSVDNLELDVSGLTTVALRNANYANDVVDFGFKNLLDVDTFNGGNVGNTQTSNGVTVEYLGGGVYKAYGTATAQTIIALGTMSYNEKLSGAKFNGLPNDADSRVFMSVREPWVSAYDTYLGTAHDYNTMGEFPTATFSTVNVALQVGSYVNLGDGTDTYLTIKPMVINNDFPTGSPYFRDPSYIEFVPYVPSMLSVRESIKAVESDVDGLQSDVSDLETDVVALQNEPKLPSVTSADNGKLLGVDNGAWGKVDAPSGGDTLYQHIFKITAGTPIQFAIAEVITTQSTRFTSETLRAYILDGHCVSLSYANGIDDMDDPIQPYVIMRDPGSGGAFLATYAVSSNSVIFNGIDTIVIDTQTYVLKEIG